MSWPAAALSETSDSPVRLDVAYFHLEILDGLRNGWARYQFGVDYSYPYERSASLDYLRKMVEREMKKRGHDSVEWVIPRGGDR